MTLASQLTTDLSTFFNADELGETASINGASVDVCVAEEGQEVGLNTQYDFIDIMIRKTDYATIDRDDVLSLRGTSWKYPKNRGGDELVRTVRFRANERPAGR